MFFDAGVLVDNWRNRNNGYLMVNQIISFQIPGFFLGKMSELPIVTEPAAT